MFINTLFLFFAFMLINKVLIQTNDVWNMENILMNIIESMILGLV
jgi:hypothetical protein